MNGHEEQDIPPTCPRRIGYLVPEFPGQTHVFFWREIEALRALGADLRLISTRRPDAGGCRHEFAARAAAETHYAFPPDVSSAAARLARYPRRLSRALAYLRGLQRAGLRESARHYTLLWCALALAEWCRRESIVHVHGHSCADAAHLLALCQRLGGPSYSLTLHGDLPVYGADHRAKFEQARFVCAVGSHLRRQILEQTGLTAERVWVTFMGIDAARLARFATARVQRRGSLHLVTVARLNAAKGHAHALAALRGAANQGADVQYTIAGEGPHRDWIERRIRELELGDRVRLVGTLSEGEVFQLLSEADAFLLPSVGDGEAWPVSVMEAMGCGLPVIASRIGATPEMITPERDGFLVEQADEAGLTEAILRLVHDVDLRRRIGDQALLTAQHRFDVRNTATRLHEAILSQMPPGAP